MSLAPWTILEQIGKMGRDAPVSMAVGATGICQPNTRSVFVMADPKRPISYQALNVKIRPQRKTGELRCFVNL
jgi:hypothetical protein